jgi:hypothetical protein
MDTLPSGMEIANNPNAVSIYNGITFTGSPVWGDKVVTLVGMIPAGSICTVMVDVTAANAGIYPNILPANALQTDKGNNINSAIATLRVGTPGTPIPEFPTVALPVIAVIGLIFLFQRRKDE